MHMNALFLPSYKVPHCLYMPLYMLCKCGWINLRLKSQPYSATLYTMDVWLWLNMTNYGWIVLRLNGQPYEAIFSLTVVYGVCLSMAEYGWRISVSIVSPIQLRCIRWMSDYGWIWLDMAESISVWIVSRNQPYAASLHTVDVWLWLNMAEYGYLRLNHSPSE
jgi:hypothetical protein